jgi:Uma2 family endonuclease
MTTSLETLPMVVRADHVPGPRQGEWTYEAYAALPDDGHRYEVIDGVLYMPPAPNMAHQATVIAFATQLMINVQHKGLGRVYASPVDVLLPFKSNPVQPDVVVVLNANLGIVTEKNITGAPDLVVEVLSPGTAGYDRRQKQDAYALAGVKEYWIVDPYAQTVEVLILEGDSYRSAGVFTGEALLPSEVLPDFPVRVEQFFA